mgnify:CR=1 FL=1
MYQQDLRVLHHTLNKYCLEIPFLEYISLFERTEGLTNGNTQKSLMCYSMAQKIWNFFCCVPLKKQKKSRRASAKNEKSLCVPLKTSEYRNYFCVFPLKTEQKFGTKFPVCSLKDFLCVPVRQTPCISR